eukprot:TRINITY_DN1342_c0_g1_i1.p1 TRINITY_DN1342_c0_g1~~TRINITY_DN1342_c0_g1_i1.p1  ORF type:complete len:363 (-),score=46.69 TRINITY_DN1342_c0_g1_i1:168-1256(-)
MDTSSADAGRERIFQHISDMMAAQSVAAFAELRIADYLRDGAKTTAEVSTTLSLHAEATERLLRAMAALGYVRANTSAGADQSPTAWECTEWGRLLDSERPDGMWASILAESDRPHRVGWSLQADCVRHGNTQLEKGLGCDVWTYYHQRDPAVGAVFSRHMTALTHMSGAAVWGALVPRISTGAPQLICDVGGAEGHLVRGLLSRLPNARGMVFDLAPVIAQAQAALPSELQGRMECVAGDFFSAVPGNADVYLLKFVLHDWGNADCERILKSVAAAMTKESRLFVVEVNMPEDPTPTSPLNPTHALPFLFDLNMLAMCPGGRERTRNQYAALFETAGLSLAETIPVAPFYAIYEAVLRKDE